MSRNFNKYYFLESDYSGLENSHNEHSEYEEQEPLDGYIVHSPYEQHKKHYSDTFDVSRVNFLEFSEDESFEQEFLEQEESRHDNTSCKGCDSRCSKCHDCQACNCKECNDYSLRSVLSDLGTSDNSACNDFRYLAEDKKQKREKKKFIYRKDRSSLKLSGVLSSSPSDESSGTHSEASGTNTTIPDAFVPSILSAMKDVIKDTKKISSNTSIENISSKDASSKDVSSKDNSTKKSSTGKKFTVSFGPKTGHPWKGYGSNSTSISINDKNGPVVHLYRGCTYFFCIEQEISGEEDPTHAFVLTSSPVGGPNSKIITGGFDPVSKGCVCFKIDECTPRYFFYQDYMHEFSGGIVMVHD